MIEENSRIFWGPFSRNQESMKPDSQGDSKIRSPDCWGADGGDPVFLASSVTVLHYIH